MEEKSYKVKKILKNIEKYNLNLLISGETKEFDINLKISNIPHLLGVHYISKEKLRAENLLREIFINNISDEEILERVEKFYGDKQRKNVENRINTFENFMNNLEKGFIVEKTNEGSKIDVNYLVIQNNKDEYYHLGIHSCDNGALLVDYSEMSKIDKDILKTYFVENNTTYFEKSKIIEKITFIGKYNDDLEEYIPFSFDEKKNQALIEAYKENRNIDYKKVIEEFENSKCWNRKDDNKDFEK